MGCTTLSLCRVPGTCLHRFARVPLTVLQLVKVGCPVFSSRPRSNVDIDRALPCTRTSASTAGTDLREACYLTTTDVHPQFTPYHGHGSSRHSIRPRRTVLRLCRATTVLPLRGHKLAPVPKPSRYRNQAQVHISAISRLPSRLPVADIANHRGRVSAIRSGRATLAAGRSCVVMVSMVHQRLSIVESSKPEVKHVVERAPDGGRSSYAVWDCSLLPAGHCE